VRSLAFYLDFGSLEVDALFRETGNTIKPRLAARVTDLALGELDARLHGACPNRFWICMLTQMLAEILIPNCRTLGFGACGAEISPEFRYRHG